MKYKSEILAIIEGGLECNESKVRAYAELLKEKLSKNQKELRFIKSIQRRLDGAYVNDPKMSAIDL